MTNAKNKTAKTKTVSKTEALNSAVASFFDAENVAQSASKAAAAFYRAAKVTNKDATDWFCDNDTKGAKRAQSAIDELKAAIDQKAKDDKLSFDRTRAGKAAKDALAVMLTGKTNIRRTYDMAASKAKGAFVAKKTETRQPQAQGSKGGPVPNAVAQANAEGNTVKRMADADSIVIAKAQRELSDLENLILALTDKSTVKVMVAKVEAVRAQIKKLA